MPRVSVERRRTAPYPALTIAKWFIAWAEAEREELSNLKLQKLLYYAQGHHLAELLSRVWNTYGGYSAGRLRNMTHQEPPWRAHFRPDERNIFIPADEIEGYFAERNGRS